MVDNISEAIVDVSSPTVEIAQVELAEARVFSLFVRRIILLLLEDASGEPCGDTYATALDECLHRTDTVEVFRRFIADAQAPALLIERSCERDSEETADATEITEVVNYTVSTEVHFSSPKTNGLILIKRGAVLEADKPLIQQLLLFILADASPYETLHSYFSTTICPYFKSFVKESGGGDNYRDTDKAAMSVEKKLIELEMGLLHLQQNIDIPDITLLIHPVVQSVIKQAAEENRRAKVSDFGKLVDDSTFLNQLQNGVTRWVREMQKVTKLDRDPSSGSALQEITFWRNLERAVFNLLEKRESPEVILTLEVLKHGKRFHATVSFDTDTGLKQALDTVTNYNVLMKDFPINDLLSAVEMDRIRAAVASIFIHLRKIRTSRYPIQRCLRLIEAISRDLQIQMLKVLGMRRILQISFDEFDKVMTQAFEVFTCWDDEYEKLQALLRDLLKKKREEQLKLIWRIVPAHKKLQFRLEEIRRFRRHHEQLRAVIVRVFRLTSTLHGNENEHTFDESPRMYDAADTSVVEEVNVAYDFVKDIDCLDLSKEGSDSWSSALKCYEERIDRVEGRIATRLRDQLGSAKNANEMFRIFSQFNALFVRPHIRGAIREYQTQLIERVKDDIEALHERFKKQYSHSKACSTSSIYDIPPVSGFVIWAKQIERQLALYLRRVEDVLGKGWENHIEGQALKTDGDIFRAKLNTQPVFDEWVTKVQTRNLGLSGRVFVVESVRRRNDSKASLRLRVNFLPDFITLAKEVRNFKNLSFRVPLAIVNKAHQVNQLYPFAMSMIESVRTYELMTERLNEKENVAILLAGLVKEIHTQIAEGAGLVWESYKLDSYVQKFSEMISHFQERVEELLHLEEQIKIQLNLLDTCQYAAPAFQQILSNIQKSVDALSLYQYSNLDIWIKRLDEEIEQKLAIRLEEGIKSWIRALKGEIDEENSSSEDLSAQSKFKVGGDPIIHSFVHEIRITQQVMYLSPCIEEIQVNLLQQLFSWEAIVTSQARISSSCYHVEIERSSALTKYRSLLAKLPHGIKYIEKAYAAIENLKLEVKDYVNEWLRYQALWDLQADTLYDRLNTDLSKWMKTLQELKEARSTFDTSETRKQFGVIVVDFARVQSKVSLKYDSWHKEILQRFGTILGNEIQNLYTVVNKARTHLEQQSVDISSTSEAVSFITYVQNLKRNVLDWDDKVECFREGQRILERQRFQFPSNWLYSENFDGEWSAFSDILSRKSTAIQSQVNTLQAKIRQEATAVETRSADVVTDWNSNKPIKGDQLPDVALQTLVVYEGKLSRLKEERDNISRAREALELQETSHTSVHGERLKAAIEELNDLKQVWQALNPLYNELAEIKERLWLSVQPRKLRQNVDSLLNQMKEMPANYRNYDAYDHLKRLLQGYAKINFLIVELKSDALKSRHWKQLMSLLHVHWNLNELTIGQIWACDLQRYESSIKEIILVAQGELALEEFLKQLREFWQTYELELINYQNKTKLIRGWDDLFNKLKEHINSLNAMKLSPYYKEFEEDCLVWEEKLNRITALFDVWIDVQRRWVYLEGIFSGSADIKTLLPTETSKFQSISSEFLGIMKKVSMSARVTEILNVPGIQRLLERLADMLNKIQKALGEYLERERSEFPRFYFVGDEDLLEIIGNSKNIPRLQKHFKKMFAGVACILFNEDYTVIHGVASREGEEVNFLHSISIKETPRVNEWLGLVEKEIQNTLAQLLVTCLQEFQKFKVHPIDADSYYNWLDKFPLQVITLAAQIAWSEDVELVLGKNANLEPILKFVENTLNLLADSVLHEHPPLRRKKIEHLITEFVHKRCIMRYLMDCGVNSNQSFYWLKQMRFYLNTDEVDPQKKLTIRMANAQFYYGFEYLGIQEKLVQTPLTDRCFLTMTQALESRLGGSPFGPAGTGKTESVKALGNQLGRFVLVFNCDENFDFQAVGRIFIGLCQVGAWGCFDEFNRLEERMLSAVSQQIQAIQETLRLTQTKNDASVELLGKRVWVSPQMAIFITMNPGYAGRSNLPDNLKQLFRSLAMTQPDKRLIAEVMLFSQGFRLAEKLASKIVPFFTLCSEQLSNQTHYDFGLRALKYVLVKAGNVKRDHIQQLKEQFQQVDRSFSEGDIGEQLPEQEILIQSVCETLVPKLVAEDIPLMFSLLSDVFPGIPHTKAEMKRLREEIRKVCRERYLCYSEVEGELGYTWAEKVIQLYQIVQLNHGLMMVGSSGTGKTKAWQVLLAALGRVDGVDGAVHVIDPKAITKDALYGTLDPNTREWTDGLFTHILRKIIDNVRGESTKRQWIIFDGDVDPEWVENLNSVLDDNKLLTLPNGERLALPQNVRIMFEVENLKYATLATVSRCGMVWFSADCVTEEMCFENYLQKLRNVSLDAHENSGMPVSSLPVTQAQTNLTDQISPSLQVQRDIANILAPYLSCGGLVARCLEFAENQVEHIMEFSSCRALSSFFSMISQCIMKILLYNQQHSDFPMAFDQMERYITRSLLLSIVWSFVGDARAKYRDDMCEMIRSLTAIALPAQENVSLIEFEVSIDGEWSSLHNRVPQVEVESHKVGAPDVVIPTIDTVLHEQLLYTWLADHKPLVLCGPPGSGKTMTLFSSLRSLPDMEVVGLNFSSATSPELLLKTFDHYCEYKRTPNGIVLSPVQLGKWIVLFCDEINLPNYDKYGTQRVISFLRQMVEHGGFYRSSDQAWVTVERIQFVGACNPPTDPGRKPLSQRFLRHIPVVYVDYPGELSLKQIYGTFNRAMLRMIPSLRSFAEPLTAAMVELYLLSQDKFTPELQPHYVYSPRELTRWVRGICEAIRPLETLNVENLVKLWAHEALRLFQDRLAEEDERRWTDEQIDLIAAKHFPNVDASVALRRPLLYSCWLTKDYLPVEREELRNFLQARLRVFYEEELDVRLVFFDEVLDHVLRIDRIFRQPQGHLLLIGVSGSGRATLSRFVAWMNGLSVFQVKIHNKYSAENFDDDLRLVLRRVGCKGEKLCFIMDESNLLDSSFLERINTLLANGEVPGLFEGDEYTTLMSQIKEASQHEGLILDSSEELYRWFTQQVMRNLHVVFTMNPSSEGLKDRVSTSPALFNRCVVNWFGDWSKSALFQVGRELTSNLDMDNTAYRSPDYFPYACDLVSRPPTYREAVVNAYVYVHETLHQVVLQLTKRDHRTVLITPRHFLDFINHYVKLFHEKRKDLVDQQRHLNIGLSKIVETEQQVTELQKSLSLKSKELEEKNALANEKLKQMLSNRQEAENQKHMSEQIQSNLQQQLAEVAAKKSDVMKQLAQVEPAVIDAQNAVKSIKKQHLVEVRSMANPPGLVKLALESICLLLGENCTEWKLMRAVIVKDDFISRIVNFDTDSVTNIRRQHLGEIRYLSSPPATVKLALEAVIFLFTGSSTLDWKSIRGYLLRDDFVSQILNFDTERITEDIRQKMKTKYLDNPEYNYEKVNRASQACGPMVKWATAQINYAEMLHKVEPLRNELKKLENDAEVNKRKVEDVNAVINQLEKSIASYKDEYALLISEVQSIKADLIAVQTKVERSIQLLQNLGSERQRWEQSSDTFKTQMETIVGDVLLSAAFISYAGYFDQQIRLSLFMNWSRHLDEAGIQFRPDISLVEYLANPDERLRWQQHALPVDELCVENAIMLKRFTRYPLIIDPSGQAIEFLMQEYGERKIIRTSFMDDAFRKNLESALRFGNSLLVQDVECYDPILNPVLNYEVKRAGGRVLITVGDQDIDLSPSFQIFLSTRDPTIQLTPDICSRVTVINFTVTRSSLQSQCLNHILKAERPDIDSKRSDLMKLQGEFALRLRHLETSLLQALNDVKGRILDDDSIISTLETLKKEAAEVSRKASETETVMMEIEKTSQLYTPFSSYCASLYFTLDHLNQMHFLYQYSLQFFMDIFMHVLNKKSILDGISDYSQRLNVITKNIFKTVYKRVSLGLLHHDRLGFALLLSRIYLKGMSESDCSFDDEFSHLLMRSDSLKTADTAPFSINGQLKLSKEQKEKLAQLVTLPAFASLAERLAQTEGVLEWMESSNPEINCPILWDESKTTTPVSQALYRLLLIQAIRPDRLLSAAHMFIDVAFGENFMSTGENILNLKTIVETEISCNMPLLLCSVPGYDASGRVDDLSSELDRGLTSIAMGSAEGFDAAEKAVNSSAKTGRWVLLKNVHLATGWLIHLEKKLHSLVPHPNFRLFLTMEIHPKLPVNLLRAGRIIVYEPPPGIKANLLRTFGTIPPGKMTKPPAERPRLFFLLAWLHALVQERLQYVPLGWTKKYEFSEADLRAAWECVDTWVDAAAHGRANLPAEKVPWNAIRTLLSQCIYGGHLDNEFDQILLDCFIEKLFSEKSFQPDFALVNNVDSLGNKLTVPDGVRREQYVNWVESVQALQSPAWLGLPSNAEKVLLTIRGQTMVKKLLKMNDEDEELAYTPIGEQFEGENHKPHWLKQIREAADHWLNSLPTSLAPLKRSVSNIKDPLYRFFEREVNIASRLLNNVRHDLADLINIVEGNKKPTNHHRDLFAHLNKGLVPETWIKYTIPSTTTITQWVHDFAERLAQFQLIVDAVSSGRIKNLKNRLWIGGLLSPEAYLTATRQHVAQLNEWSLEELKLDVQVANTFDNLEMDDCSFGVTGLKIMGVSCSEQGRLKISPKIWTDLQAVQLRWVHGMGAEKQKLNNTVRLPVYLYTDRQRVLFSLDFQMDPAILSVNEFYERGVAIVCNGLMQSRKLILLRKFCNVLFLLFYRMMLSKSRNLVALITGGASGLGKGCAEQLLKMGSKIVLMDLPTSSGAEVAESLHKTDVVFSPGDVTSESDVSKTLEFCRQKFGKLDAVVNCAAIGVAFTIYNNTKKQPHPLEPFESVFRVNVLGTFNVVRQSIGIMMEKELAEDEERGVIIMTSSTAAFEGQQGQTVYAACCGALNSMTLPLARDCSRHRIRVVTIAPGLFNTPLTSFLPEKVRQFFARLTPYPHRFGQPAEFGHLVQSVIENPMINGEVIRIDGGLRMPP
ncbi:Dynein heavy chain, cytoplasmic [Trichinella papuae]|uniref:Dynein heavy chain, cytoplasmic n=2 Tax=Trichinella papuae TaxID=268474 RepID=A0A0V1N0P8_9BILA|nr:Dynein heavy chain, cytoplasmic [Trichinella papuae]